MASGHIGTITLKKRSEGSYLWAYHKGTWVIKDKDWTYWHEDGTLADEKEINELCIYTKKVKNNYAN